MIKNSLADSRERQPDQKKNPWEISTCIIKDLSNILISERKLKANKEINQVPQHLKGPPALINSHKTWAPTNLSSSSNNLHISACNKHHNRILSRSKRQQHQVASKVQALQWSAATIKWAPLKWTFPKVKEMQSLRRTGSGRRWTWQSDWTISRMRGRAFALNLINFRRTSKKPIKGRLGTPKILYQCRMNSKGIKISR